MQKFALADPPPPPKCERNLRITPYELYKTTEMNDMRFLDPIIAGDHVLIDDEAVIDEILDLSPWLPLHIADQKTMLGVSGVVVRKGWQSDIKQKFTTIQPVMAITSTPETAGADANSTATAAFKTTATNTTAATNGTSGSVDRPVAATGNGLPLGAMYVVKRDGRHESIMFDKITSRIVKLSYELDTRFVDPTAITLKVIAGLYSGVTTVQLDELAAEIAATMTTKHADYAKLAARIAVSNLHKETTKNFSDVIRALYAVTDAANGRKTPLISEETYRVVMDNAERLNSAIIYDRDFHYQYFGFKTLERSYLLRIGGKIVERPQHLLMRAAVGIHGQDIDAAIETYNLMSDRWFTHASPTLFNAGTPRPQLSSCFLLTMSEDSIEGIFDTLKQCAVISKAAGGIGLNVHCIRAAGTPINGTNGISNGLVPMLRCYNNVARYVDQGGNKRPGAFAIYIEPWHADIFQFLDLRKNHGAEEQRARDLFLALWVPDLFMKRVEADGMWSLMCPHECPGLFDSWGEKFE
ncbi:unnamed protein product, partial [Medioppia subpectinata]